ncbi:MAG: SIMPL domain-containing protein [Gammaproteobacteria bacterium]|nr:SIMPL domain-containing protein [Gammaproteobacteria bacterium]
MPRLLVLLLPLLVATAHADEHGPTRNLVSLSVSAREDVQSDLLIVQLAAQHDGREQAKAGAQVNEDMTWAVGKARQVKGIKAQTQDYRSDPMYDDGRIAGWQVRQGLRLESADHAALTALLGELQQRLAIESVSYGISDAARDVVDERLIAAAIKRYGARAAAVAESFGRKSYTLVNVNIDHHGAMPPPVAYAGRALAMKAEAAAPTIEAGTQSVEVTVSGTIELAP